ncbi:hypothetical protein F2Q70_00015920 [Brassica cretica]|uniref:Uncharacterized protein n=1 Tax=Brassica cretica TaxID=69181 RepID=A0A8S9HT51_BRACR|nr:hypothetical protein F2Q70_00015920 [Brassica cretica]
MILISPIIIHPKPSNVEIQDEAASELQVIIFGRKGGESRRRDDSLLEDKKVPRSPNKQKIQEKKSETIPMVGGLASNKAREKVCSIEVKLVMSSMGLYGSKGLIFPSDFATATIAFVRFGSVWWFEMAQGFVILIFFVFPPNDFSFHLFGLLGEPPAPSHFIVSIRKLTYFITALIVGFLTSVWILRETVQITSQSSGLLHLNGYS